MWQYSAALLSVVAVSTGTQAKGRGAPPFPLRWAGGLSVSVTHTGRQGVEGQRDRARRGETKTARQGDRGREGGCPPMPAKDSQRLDPHWQALCFGNTHGKGSARGLGGGDTARSTKTLPVVPSVS